MATATILIQDVPRTLEDLTIEAGKVLIVASPIIEGELIMEGDSQLVIL